MQHRDHKRMVLWVDGVLCGNKLETLIADDREDGVPIAVGQGLSIIQNKLHHLSISQ